MKLFSSIFNYKNDSVIQNSRITYLKFFYYVCLITFPIFIVKNYFQYSSKIWIPFLVPMLLFLAATPYLPGVKKSFNKTALIIITLATIMLSLLLYEAGGLNSPGIFWIVIMPISYGIVLGPRGCIYGAGLVSLTLFIMKILELNGLHGSITFSTEEFYLEHIVDVIIFVITIILITLQFVTNEELAKKKLEEFGKEIDTLLSVVIHDIGSPITISSLSFKKIIDPKTTPEQNKKAMQRLSNGLETIEKILNQIKFLKSNRDGKHNLKTDVINVFNCIENLLDLHEETAQAKGLHINLISDRRDFCIKIDEVAFRNFIISNFITNAIKFSRDNSSIEIHLEEHNNNLHIIIRDYGVGIPDDILIHIWKFKSASTRLGTKGEKGTGYGLPLAKEFTEKMNGKIEVKSWTEEVVSGSSQKSGTEFTLIFPLVKEDSLSLLD